MRRVYVVEEMLYKNPGKWNPVDCALTRERAKQLAREWLSYDKKCECKCRIKEYNPK